MRRAKFADLVPLAIIQIVQFVKYAELALYVWKVCICSLFTVNDLINARGVYLIFGVQVGALNRWEALKRERRLLS